MANETQKDTSVSSWVWWVVGGVAMVLLLYWIFSTPTQPSVPNTGTGSGTATSSGSSSGPATVTAIRQNPSSYDGSTVSVQGVVGNIYQSRVIVLTESATQGGAGLVVISPTRSTVTAGQEINVTGMIRVGTARDILNKMGLEVPTGSDAIVRERAVLVADTITQVPSSSTQTPTTQTPTTQTTPSTQTAPTQ